MLGMGLAILTTVGLIYKLGADIYVSGFENNEATYWKNGKQVKIDVNGVRESYITGIY